ncbi:hypothetical protein POM88_048026 [Heracleum sosnowskyi]|uniref:Guanylate-binding protein/Atlastin C-terminal domain-containing protein n=1 Tax=Heracleum sosnowskyi TaxID=360622 RepID=A0AAD8GT45_9APIA|nr:hypothetical protein POM88_048026 [Heracleum sosnowskyi]
MVVAGYRGGSLLLRRLDEDLDQNYVEKREKLKQLVVSVIRPKVVQGKHLNGKEFVAFLEQILEALNKGEIPSTGSLVEVFNKGILERCLQLYNDRMEKVVLPVSVESLQAAHEASREVSMKAFDEQHFGRNHAKKSVEQLDEEIKKVHKNFIMANEFNSAKLCEGLYIGCEDKMDELQVLRLPSMAKFNAGFLHCNRSFEIDCVGPSKTSYENRMRKAQAVNPSPSPVQSVSSQAHAPTVLPPQAVSESTPVSAPDTTVAL